ncbi:MAG TPA: hypothetical protein VFZ16_12705 [Hyphomicrobiaceae bacterium]|nr:hypothetical protein [Hyphomicrobiaceae bacterium]
MSRRFLHALSLAACVASLAALAAAPARAGHYRTHFDACVAAKHGAWLIRPYCDSYRCWRPVHYGRAFRVLRQDDGYLLVRNVTGRGWIELNSLRIVPQAYCRAAGI